VRVLPGADIALYMIPFALNRTSHLSEAEHSSNFQTRLCRPLHPRFVAFRSHLTLDFGRPWLFVPGPALFCDRAWGLCLLYTP
jgi:hypothetical protein